MLLPDEVPPIKGILIVPVPRNHEFVLMRIFPVAESERVYDILTES